MYHVYHVYHVVLLVFEGLVVATMVGWSTSPPPTEAENWYQPTPHISAVSRYDPKYLIMRVLGSGTYGEVRSVSSRVAIKSTRMFSRKSLSSNFSEAVLAASLISRPAENVVSIIGLETRDNMFEISMERGRRSLWEHAHELTWTQRNAAVECLIKDLCTGLLRFHSMGIVHCDVKPGNIIVMSGGSVRLIDFGSARLWSRPTAPDNSQRQVYGTRAFCAPETLASRVDPTPACDAYSLGATIHSFLMKEQLFTDAETMDWTELSAMVYGLHNRRGGIMGFTEPPTGMSAHTFRLLTGLLHPDPLQRTSICVLAGSYHIQLPHVQMLILDGYMPGFHSHDIITMLYGLGLVYKCGAAFPLAVSIALRYASVSWPLLHGSLIASMAIAISIINPDSDMTWSYDVLSMVLVIMTTLDHQLYADTCDWILMSVHGQATIDLSLLHKALVACGGRTLDTVDLYLSWRACEVAQSNDIPVVPVFPDIPVVPDIPRIPGVNLKRRAKKIRMAGYSRMDNTKDMKVATKWAQKMQFMQFRC